LLWIFGAALAARADDLVHDAGAWSSLTAQVGLHGERSTGPRLWLDLHARRTDAQFLAIVRPAVGWDLGAATRAFVGYAWVPAIGDATDRQWLTEHRLWEQLLWSRSEDGWAIAVRPRLEQRFFVGDPEVAHRVRWWVRGAAPVTGDWSIAMVDEAFIGFNQTSLAPAGFDQNRWFIGPSLDAGDGVRVEFGYLGVWLNRDTDTWLHLASANLGINR
jgi:hypothetical protein